MQPGGSIKYTCTVAAILDAMKVTFVGTGESCDPLRRNLSVLVEDNEHGHLLDCGFSSPHGFLSRSPHTNLDTIWISHFHGDHFFGLPQLFLHFYMLKRTQQLTVISGINGKDRILDAMTLAYPELHEKLPFPINFIELPAETERPHNGLLWQCAPVLHSLPAYALRIRNNSHSIYYSGDGKATEQSIKLMQNCDLVIHEAFSSAFGGPYHSSIDECLLLAEKLSICQLALVHLNQEARQFMLNRPASLNRLTRTKLILPQDDDEILL